MRIWGLLGIGLSGFVATASCNSDDPSNGGAAGEASAGDAPIAGSPDQPGGAAGQASHGGSAAGSAGESGGAGAAAAGGGGGVFTGGAGGESGGSGTSTEAGSPSGGASGAGGTGGEGGSTDSFGCTDNEFPLLGEPTTCVTCGSYHYTAYDPVFLDVCEVYGTGHFYDRVAHKLYIEAKPGFPAPTGWAILRQLGDTADYVRISSYDPEPCPQLVCEPPPAPACAANPFPIHLSASGKYLVADVSEAAACAESTQTPMLGQFGWSRIDYGCAGSVSTRIEVDFSMNADDADDFVGISCLAGDGLEPKKVDGPPP
jgi:hypothetical protein